MIILLFGHSHYLIADFEMIELECHREKTDRSTWRSQARRDCYGLRPRNDKLNNSANRYEMRKLRDLFGDTVSLAVLLGAKMMYLETVEGTNPLRFVEPPGAVGPLHATALGKALLAWRDPKAMSDLIKRSAFKSFTENTISSAEALLRDLEVARESGFVVDNEESVLGARCIAVPIFDQGEVVASMSISAPASTLAADRQSAMAQALAKASARISRKLKVR